MKIGFLITGIGVYGSVRELVENANVFSRAGHECFVFNPDGEKFTWIECLAKPLMKNKILDYELDILFMCCQPFPEYFRLFVKARAKKKVFVIMGFDQNHDFLTDYKNFNYILENYYITGDGLWQNDWLRENTNAKGILQNQFGGINLKMFHPMPRERRENLRIGWTGDDRPRKGGKVLKEYMDKNMIFYETYFKKNIPQNKIRDWFAGIDIFIDNHNRGGWCNPVAEAMACGSIVICSDLPCNQQFAIDNVTALKFKMNDMEGMHTRLTELYDCECVREDLRKNSIEKVKEFDYEIISMNLLKEIESL
jgi:hypothetical protein